MKVTEEDLSAELVYTFFYYFSSSEEAAEEMTLHFLRRFSRKLFPLKVGKGGESAGSIIRSFLREGGRPGVSPSPEQPGLRGGISSLPPYERTAVILKDIMDLPVPWILHSLRLSQGSFRTMLNSGRLLLAGSGGGPL